MVEILFWSSLIVLAYILFGYPLLILIISRFRPDPTQQDIFAPFVSVVIAAYNEEKVIRERINNCLNLDYPKNKMEVIIASDGSTDKTNEIVSEFEDRKVHLVICPERGGKVKAFNRAVPQSRGEILAFSDANSQFEKNAIFNLVRHFKDPRIGCVAGQKVILTQSETGSSIGEGFYWRYEQFIKEKESLVHSTMGADGSIYAIRKNLYVAPKEGVGYSDDFIISMSVIEKGYRLIYDKDAIVYETASDSIESEFKRKIRTLSGGIHGYIELRKLLIPFKSPVWLQLWSHRILRFFIPYLLLILFFSNLVLLRTSSLYLFMFIFQSIVYLLAMIGGILFSIGKKKRLFYIPYYFSLMNFVYVPALLRFLLGRTEIKWEKMGR